MMPVPTLTDSFLRDLADLALKSDSVEKSQVDEVAIFSEVEVNYHHNKLKDKVLEAANYGYLETDYSMGGCPLKLIEAVAYAFKMSTHKVFVSVHGGTEKIFVNWRPSQEC